MTDCNPEFRPVLTEYVPMLQELTQKLNGESWTNLSKTDVVKIAIERFYKNAFPEKKIRRMKRKYFILCNF